MPDQSKICCICLHNSVILHNLHETTSTSGTKIIDKLNFCFPTQHWHNDFNTCDCCREKLETVYSFALLCLDSEQYRKDQLIVKESKSSCQLETNSSFTCFDCNKSFRLKRTLSLHITRMHINPRRLSKQQLKPKEEDVKCKTEVFQDDLEIKDVPLVQFSAEEFPRKVFKIDSNDSDYEADNHFDAAFNSDTDLEISKEKKPYKGRKRGPKLKSPQKCSYCDLEFSRTDRYIHHVRSKHTFEKPFKCEICNAKYYSQHNLNIHLRKHRNEKPFVCSICGKCFTSSNDLWQHNKIHDQVRQYGCNECDKCFKTHSNLRTHKLQMHQDPSLWKFVCTVCGKKFPLNNNLVKHMRRHEGIKDFLCHLCDKRFVEKIDLQAHLLSHSNERNFKCHVCFKEYKKKETLRRHLKTEHNLGNFVVKKPEKKLNCPMCPKLFAFNNKLQRHILTHTGEKPYKCDYCEKRFRDTYDRNCHIRHTHNVEPSNTAT